MSQWEERGGPWTNEKLLLMQSDFDGTATLGLIYTPICCRCMIFWPSACTYFYNWPIPHIYILHLPKPCIHVKQPACVRTILSTNQEKEISRFRTTEANNIFHSAAGLEQLPWHDGCRSIVLMDAGDSKIIMKAIASWCFFVGLPRILFMWNCCSSDCSGEGIEWTLTKYSRS